MKHKLFSAILILSVLLGTVLSIQPDYKAQAAGPLCYVDDTAVGLNDGSNWTDAFIDLQSAFIDPGCTTIQVAEGIYYPTSEADRSIAFQLHSGVEIYGGYPNGGGDTPDPGTHVTILSGDIGVPGDNSDNSYHVVDASGVNSSALLSGFTITGGHADGLSSLSEGAGVYISGGSPTLYNLVISGNTAAAEGGGIYAYASTPNLTNLLLVDNSATRGGGMANFYSTTSEIMNATISGNQATIFGSAIYNYQSSPALTNSIVWGNTRPISGTIIMNEGYYSLPSITRSILEEGCPGYASCHNLISGDPQFSDPANDDYHLSVTSPAVDTGDAAVLPADVFDLDGDEDLAESIPYDLDGNRRVVVARVDLGVYEAQEWNTNWTGALTLPLEEIEPGINSTTIDRYLDRDGQSRWYKFSVQPDSKVLVTLTGLPDNYDLTLYKDIAQAYNELNSTQDLVQLSAEFAPDTFSPDTFSPDTFSPDTFSPDTFSPDTFSPDTFSPDTFSPDTFSPDTFSPDTFSPDTFSPDTFSPDTFSPDTFSPDTFSPDTFSPDTFSPDTFSPDTFSSAQTRSLIAISAHDGTLGEGIIVNTWTKSGDFYLRVRGRYGAFDAQNPFRLQVTLLSGVCGPVSPLLPPSTIQPVDGGYQTLILTNPGMTEGTADDVTLMQANLDELAAATGGHIVDVGTDDRVSAAALQAETNSACVYAKNLEAYAIKDFVDGFRALNPLEYLVLVGSDRAIPFFRYPDNALLASESDYSPPVRDDTTSQASLKSGYILTQDTYGAAVEISNKAQTLPVPDLAVGRLVETAADINAMLDAYLALGDGTLAPTNALVTGYDFLEDTANAVRDELQEGLSQTAVNTLIMSSALSPEDSSAWTADDLSESLLGSHHDLVFLAGHFSAWSALAADYKTRLETSDLVQSGADFTNSLVYSAGCHSGYNIVNEHDVPNVTQEPDWAQAFAAKGATFIGGTGYQYGDTEFIEYSERLYLEFTRQLRYGNEPVAVGKALTQAKQVYLANTPLMRGIHEKSVLEATLFGLPMLQVDLPNHSPAPADDSLVESTTIFASGPGYALTLNYADLSLTPELSEQTVDLDIISPSDDGISQVTASYLQGPDGVVANPAEPVLPLDMLNVSHREAGFVLRGVGWRGGTYSDLPDRLPLTGAATDELRAPHPAFFSEVFYPIRPWNVNYFDALAKPGGATRLALMPAQYRSSAPGSLEGTLRRFDSMDFRLYYSDNIQTYSSSDPNWTNVPALAAPPDIARISSSIDEAPNTVSFEVTVTGDPAAGIQEAWIVYTGEIGSLYGTWLPLDLVQDPVDSRLWKGSLSTGDTLPGDLRFVVQAVNGVGLVTMMTNEGAYYRAGVDPGAVSLGQTPATLTLEQPGASGQYGDQAVFSATFTSQGDSLPLAGVPVAFKLGGQGRLGVTNSDGLATVSFFLLAQPGEYVLSAIFKGNETFTPASASGSFEIAPGTSELVLEPAELEVSDLLSPQFTATLTSSGRPLTGKPVALTLDAGETRLYTSVEVTDYAGQAHWQLPAQRPGNYIVTAWFGQRLSPELDLSNPFYSGSTSSSATLIIYPIDFGTVFSGFFPPVDNLPATNQVKAGSAVPVKFSLGGDFGLDIFAGGYPAPLVTSCESGDVSELEETVSAGASSLAYDPLTDQYNYIWKTDKEWAGTCRTLVLKFIDGTEKEAYFRFKK